MTFGYDDADRRTSMVDSTGTTTWTYNAASEVTQLATPQGTVSYTYQTSGRRATMVETGVGTTTYGYDTAGRMTSLQNPFSETTAFQHDAARRLTRRTLHSGAYTTIGYCCCLPTSVVHKKSDNSTISSESYVYSNAGNMTSKTVDGVTTTYTYDNADQLLTESRTGYSASYTYDANGNRVTKTLNSVTDTYTTDSGDKLTSISLGAGGTKTFGYDAAGRTTSVVTSAGTTTLAYDYESRITTITFPNLSTNSFQYNGLGTRTQKVESSGTKNFKRDGVDLADPVLDDGVANYTLSFSERRNGATKYVHQDYMGTHSRLTDSSQATTDTRQYDAFGNLVSSTGSTPTPFGYVGAQGYQTDADSGLMLLGYRYYDPALGRFFTRDPSLKGRNWYVYCSSDPVTHFDPQGLLQMRYVLLIKEEPIDFYLPTPTRRPIKTRMPLGMRLNFFVLFLCATKYDDQPPMTFAEYNTRADKLRHPAEPLECIENYWKCREHQPRPGIPLWDDECLYCRWECKRNGGWPNDNEKCKYWTRPRWQ